MITLEQMCCAGIILAFVICLALLIVWASCHVAALDRRIDGNGPTS
jgi:hypothetical protein